TVTDGLCVLTASAHDVCDQHDLIVGMSVEVGRFGVVFGFERIDELANNIALIGRVKLNDADIADSRLAGLLLEAEGKPYRAELYGLAAAAFDDAGLCERLCDLQALAFQRIGRDDVNLAKAGDACRNRCKVIHVPAEADIVENLTTELGEGFRKHFCIADSRI